MIAFRCPTCSQALQVGDGLAGQPSRCPYCEEVSRVPAIKQAKPIEAEPKNASRPDPCRNIDAEPTHCTGCGKPLHIRLYCRRCRVLFCSEVCLNRHAQVVHGAQLGRRKSGCAGWLAALLIVGLIMWALIPSKPSVPSTGSGNLVRTDDEVSAALDLEAERALLDVIADTGDIKVAAELHRDGRAVRLAPRTQLVVLDDSLRYRNVGISKLQVRDGDHAGKVVYLPSLVLKKP
jgi:hypothetical protein